MEVSRVQFDFLNDEYECLIECHSDAGVVGRVMHVCRSGGVRNSIQVALFSVYTDNSWEDLNSHQRIDLFLDAYVRYQGPQLPSEFIYNEEETSLVAQAPPTSLSSLGCCNNDLPAALVDGLIEHELCDHPIAMQVHSAQSIADPIYFGNVEEDS